MSSANVGWMFYKEVFRKMEDPSYPRDMQTVNKDILNTTLSKYPFLKGTEYAIELTTAYPGLVIGSGYTHALKDEKENFNFGFFLDHTTGLPIIPGSTLKGVLRSLFGQNKNDKYKVQKEKLIDSLLPESAKGKVGTIHKAIFEGINPDGSRQATYERDIFLDAFVIGPKGTLLAEDSITPHKDPFKDPVPNKMLKLAPGVTIRFAFELHDLKEGKETLLSAAQKEELFLELLQWQGIGAKTNVGYGQFEEWTVKDLLENRDKQAKKEAIAQEKPADKIIKEFNGNLANIVSAYEQSLKDRVAPFLSDFKEVLLSRLRKELESVKNNKKDKIQVRIDKVQGW